KQEHDVDIVLVSVGDMKAIKKAYPNYFLDTNQFIKEMQSAFKKYT
ncbi:(p)ppGpp synthetase, partial [Acinetobacter baumannii]